MKLLCIGDSNTYGFDPGSWLGSRYPSGVRWTGRLQNWDVINCGVNGMSVPRHHTPFVELIAGKDPDAVFVMLGSNDLLEGAGAAEVADRMESFIDSIRVTGLPILLVAPTPFRHGDWVESEAQIEESRKLGALYRALAERKGCLFADAGEWDIEVTFDGVHFTPDGHAVFAQRIEEIKIRENA